MGLRLRIALVLAVACALAAVVVGAIGYRSTETRLVDELDRALGQTSTLVVVRAQGQQLPRVLGDVYSVRQIDSDGDVARSNFVADVPVDEDVLAGAVGAPLSRQFHSESAEDGDRYRVVTVGLERGAVQIARPLAEVDNVLDDLRRRTLLLVGLTALGGAAVGWLVAGRIAAPLRRLAGAAESVEASGRLDVDLGPAGGSDEVGRLRRSFGSMLEALSRSKADQQRLVQDAGHELRTPLTSLSTNLAVLRRHRDLPDDVRAEVLAELDAEVGELTDLVDELVAAAQGEQADEIPIEVDVTDLVTTVAERVGRRRGRDVRVTGPDDEAATVLIGPLGASRAITNLVDNACKFDLSGGPIDVSIEVRSAPTGHIVAVRVADRGPGIPDDELGRVFDRFHRVESTRTMPGSGLGLAIVRDVVERAGGAVVAVNRPGGGAEVGFDLPAGPVGFDLPAGPVGSDGG